MSRLINFIHKHSICTRRVRVLSALLTQFLPENSRILDVGCGDGEISRAILSLRSDLKIQGIDVLLRGVEHIPVTQFDGHTIPFRDRLFDVVMFVDVLHHATEPLQLLREASRVAAHAIVVKDHTAEGFLADLTLRFMDRAGNERYGVALPYNFWTNAQWTKALESVGLSIVQWRSRLHLYPWPASVLFDRSLHFIARLQSGWASS